MSKNPFECCEHFKYFFGKNTKRAFDKIGTPMNDKQSERIMCGKSSSSDRDKYGVDRVGVNPST